MLRPIKPLTDDASQEADAIYLNLLIELFGDSVEDFLHTQQLPDHIMDFIQKSSGSQLRTLFMETAKQLHKTRHDVLSGRQTSPANNDIVLDTFR